MLDVPTWEEAIGHHHSRLTDSVTVALRVLERYGLWPDDPHTRVPPRNNHTHAKRT